MNRRNFLTGTALAGTATLFGGPALLADSRKPMKIGSSPFYMLSYRTFR